jgi:hypothetical protein
LTWQGYRENSSTVETISITDYFDCDGSKGIHAVMFATQSWYCGGCQQEASALEGEMASWGPQGIKVGVMLLTGSSDYGATTGDALEWKNQWGLQSVAVVADPGASLMPAYADSVPQQSVVDPRTMQVVFLEAGYSGYYPELLALAQQNGGP